MMVVRPSLTTIAYTKPAPIFAKIGGYWASRTAVSIEKGLSVSSKIRERGVFFKLGYEHGIRFGRERDAGDGVSEGEFTKALSLTQTTNHMPGKVWD